MRPHVGDAELVVRGAQRRRQLLADDPPAGGVGRQRVREVLAADHRPPRPVQLAARRRRRRPPRVTGPVGRSCAAIADRLRERTLDVDVGQRRRRRTTARRPGVPGRVDVRRVRHGQHVAAGVVERPPGAVRAVGDVHLVAHRPLDRLPGRASPGGRRRRTPSEVGRVEPRRVAGEGGAGADADPVLPVGACELIGCPPCWCRPTRRRPPGASAAAAAARIAPVGRRSGAGRRRPARCRARP